MKKTLTAMMIIAAATCWAQIQFTGRLQLYPEWNHIKTEGASVVIETMGRIVDATHTTGTNAAQMNAFARTAGTLTNGAETVHDLQAINNSFGDTVVFYRLNFLAVNSAATNTDTITVGGATGSVFSAWAGATNHTVTVRPGGTFMLYAPDATGYVSTNGNLRIANDGTNSVTYELYIGGAQ